MLLQRERIWITGAQGQVGSAFARMLDTTELDVLISSAPISPSCSNRSRLFLYIS